MRDPLDAFSTLLFIAGAMLVIIGAAGLVGRRDPGAPATPSLYFDAGTYQP